MKVSAKAEYACLAMLALAHQKADAPPLRIREISTSHGIPERYLVQILLQLKSAGLVASTRGASGGYRLSRPPEEIALSAILLAIDGPDQASREGPQSKRPAARILATVWDKVRQAEHDVLDRTTIGDLVKQSSPLEWVI